MFLTIILLQRLKVLLHSKTLIGRIKLLRDRLLWLHLLYCWQCKDLPPTLGLDSHLGCHSLMILLCYENLHYGCISSMLGLINLTSSCGQRHSVHWLWEVIIHTNIIVFVYIQYRRAFVKSAIIGTCPANPLNGTSLQECHYAAANEWSRDYYK